MTGICKVPQSVSSQDLVGFGKGVWETQETHAQPCSGLTPGSGHRAHSCQDSGDQRRWRGSNQGWPGKPPSMLYCLSGRIQDLNLGSCTGRDRQEKVIKVNILT